MTEEFLKKLGVAEEHISSILEENKKDTDGVSAKYGDYDDIKSQLTTANKQIEDFGKLDYEGVKKSADEYRRKYEESEKESKAKLEKLQFDHILEAKLAAKKPRNATAVRALLDMESLKLSKDGDILGLSEQLDRIAKDNDYLFESAEPVPKVSSHMGGGAPAPTDTDAARAVMGLPPLTK